MNRTRKDRPGRRMGSPRGSAVVLALIVAAIAVVLGLALAGTRDATVATSANLAKAASARAAAAGALDVARSMLSDPAVLDGTNGVLFDALPIGGARVRAEINDLETGQPATPAARAVEVVVSGDRAGIVQKARAVGRIERAEDAGRADLDCSEFAVLTRGPLVVSSGAHVGPWRASPLSALAEPVRIGNASGSTALLDIDPRASLHGCVTLRNASFAADRESADVQLADKVVQIPTEIHVPAPPMPARSRDGHDAEDGAEGTYDGSTAGPAGADPSEALLDGAFATALHVESDARVPARGSAAFRGMNTIEIAGNLLVERDAHLAVEGAIVLVVRGNAVFDACAIEIAPEASLTVIAFGDVTFEGCYAGGLRNDPNEGCDASGAAAYDGGAGRLMVFVHGDQRVLLVDGAVLKGQIYAPDARIDVEARSAVYGRLLAERVTLHEGVAIFYDPALDSRRGWTNRWSGIWISEGTIDGAVREVTRLDAESLRRFADETGIAPDVSSLAEAAIELAAGQHTAGPATGEPSAGGDAGHAGGSSAQSAEAEHEGEADGPESEEADRDRRDRGMRRAQRAIDRLRDLIERGVIDGSRFVSLGFDTPRSENER